MGYKIFIGDNKSVPSGCDYYAHGSCAARDYLLYYVPEVIYLNYNIDGNETGYDILKFIENENATSLRFRLPKKIIVNCASASERAKMQLKINSIYKWENKEGQ